MPKDYATPRVAEMIDNDTIADIHTIKAVYDRVIAVRAQCLQSARQMDQLLDWLRKKK